MTVPIMTKKQRSTEEQISYALAQESRGQTIAEICRKLDVSTRTFYRCSTAFESIDIAKVSRINDLEDENA
jgi:putative transposase